jgi:hypothetical protein
MSSFSGYEINPDEDKRSRIQGRETSAVHISSAE